MFPIRDTQNSNSFPFINLLLIIANIYVFFLEITAPDLEIFVRQYSLIPRTINFANLQSLQPFVTSMFLHGGFLHILSNMWFLWIFGDNVEGRIGHIKYLGFYLFCGIAASLVQYIFMPNSSVPMLGASGAIAGVLGAYLKNFPRNSIDTIVPIFGFPAIIAIPAGFMLIYWFVIQAFNGVASITVETAAFGGIAYLAHAGGFVTGFLCSRYFIWQRR